MIQMTHRRSAVPVSLVQLMTKPRVLRAFTVRPNDQFTGNETSAALAENVYTPL